MAETFNGRRRFGRFFLQMLITFIQIAIVNALIIILPWKLTFLSISY